MDALGQAGSGFLVATAGDTVVLVDPHAAHEKVLYTELLARSRQQTARCRRIAAAAHPGRAWNAGLTRPHELQTNMTFSRDAVSASSNSAPAPFDARAVPVSAASADPEVLVAELIERLDNRDAGTEERRHRLAALVACHCGRTLRRPSRPGRPAAPARSARRHSRRHHLPARAPVGAHARRRDTATRIPEATAVSRPMLVIVGPTCSGKTALAVATASKLRTRRDAQRRLAPGPPRAAGRHLRAERRRAARRPLPSARPLRSGRDVHRRRLADGCPPRLGAARSRRNPCRRRRRYGPLRHRARRRLRSGPGAP